MMSMEMMLNANDLCLAGLQVSKVGEVTMNTGGTKTVLCYNAFPSMHN